MELFLNLLWLAVALAAFGRLAAWSRDERDRRRVAAAAVVTACIVALLFPIISITDDLAESIAAGVETSAVRRVMNAAAHVIFAVTVIAIGLLLVGFIAEKAFALPSAPALSAVALRGPPLACL